MTQTFKTGKKDPVNKKSVSFGDFLTTLPTAPLVDFAPNYVYPMFGNDQWGDCVCADEGHSQQVVTGLLTGNEYVPTLQEIEIWYETQNPSWTPASGSEGNGMDMQTFLEYLTAQKKVLGFAKVDFHNVSLFQAAIYLGLSIKVGVQLQQAQMDQFNEGKNWDYVTGSKNIGGHDICFLGYNATTKMYFLVTWGKLIQCTQAFVDNLVDEAWFPVRQEHVDHPGFRNSFDLAAFSQAVSEITGGKVVIPVTPAPVKERTLRLEKPYMKGDDVKALQVALGITDADGKYGPDTVKAVKAFQSSHGLRADGIVGPVTWKLINSL